MYKVWLEWDFGQDNKVFKTKKSAKKWIQEEVLIVVAISKEFSSVEELLESGLVGIEKVEIL
jgi:hypothetical protein